MNIIQITPGAGDMYCGNCVRDNALVRALRQLGHATTMVPLYLPLTLDEPDQSAGTPIFFSGLNVYLDQKSALFRRAPEWLHRMLGSPKLLKWVAGKAAKTRAEDVGDLTLSMLRGEDGYQARELEQLTGWLRTQPKPDVICLSNALLAGMAGRLKRDLGAPVVCSLQGEDAFLDGLPERYRYLAWKTLAERATAVDRFIAPSRYFGSLMGERLGIPAERISIVPNGINLDGYMVAPVLPDPPVLGFFARMCREKGLDTLIEAFILLRQRSRVKHLKLRVGGSCGPADEAFLEKLRERLKGSGLLGEVEFRPNLDHAGKLAFLRSLSVFSVPALYGEAFGLYVLEALAAGVPVVQPSVAAFPEVVQQTGGGVLCPPGDPKALAVEIEELLLNPENLRHLGKKGREAVVRDFSIQRMAEKIMRVYEEAGAGKTIKCSASA